MRRSTVMRSRATDGRSAPKCQRKRPDLPLDRRSGRPRCGSLSAPNDCLVGRSEKRKNSRQFGDHLGNPGQYVQEWRINMSKKKAGDSESTLDKKKLNRRNFIKRSAAI